MFIRAFIPLLTFSILLWGCAGSQKIVEKKAETQEKILVNANSPAADSLVSKLPRFAYLFFKDIVDSLPNEYYYSTKNNVIDSLFKKENEHYEVVATIHFDSTQNKKNDYILQKKNWVWMVSNGMPKRSFEGNVLIKPSTNEFECSRDCITRIYNEKGRLTQEFLFPKYLKTFSDSGKLESEISGILYKANTFKNNDAQDSIVFKVEDGEEKTYYEFGILKTWAEIKNRKSVSQKKWNEKGVVTLDYKLPKYLKTFYDNGNLKEEYSGTLYRGTDTIRVDNGTKMRYYENGNIQAQMEIKNRKKISEKRWYESGNLEYEYFYEHQKWAEIGKVWNEQGVLIKEFKAPDFYKEFYANGTLKQELTGISSKSPTEFIVNNGISKFYYENGKIQNQIKYTDYKKVSEDTWYESGRHESSVTFDSSGLIVAEKKWNDKGLMTKDLKFPQCILGRFFDIGMIRVVHHDLDFQFRLAARRIYVLARVDSALGSVHVLEAGLAAQVIVVIRAGPAPATALIGVRANHQGIALLERDFRRLVPVTIVDLHVRDDRRRSAIRPFHIRDNHRRDGIRFRRHRKRSAADGDIVSRLEATSSKMRQARSVCSIPRLKA